MKDVFYSIEPFWMLLHYIPFSCMTEDIGIQLGFAFGQVLKVEVDGNGFSWETFLRVRMEFDITKPLICGRFLKIDEKQMWIPFQYKRLPTFYFNCGAIKHLKRSTVLSST